MIFGDTITPNPLSRTVRTPLARKRELEHYMKERQLPEDLRAAEGIITALVISLAMAPWLYVAYWFLTR